MSVRSLTKEGSPKKLSGNQWAWALSLTILTLLFIYMLNNMKPGKYITPYEEIINANYVAY
jgi:hypothetical protein